ncbi:hypothetical protein ACIRF8_15020 [Streptomyces sp. NPDC102406]|uniref:hypothetical protein n=1 Tax=Streptomyces sp. NPDC102406 TaxID=3366171 RepID=UPI00382A86F0
MQVERSGGGHFAPFIVDSIDGCTFVFHEDDITPEGAGWFSQAMTEQARRWLPRTMEMPRGPIVPVRIIREPVLPDPYRLRLDDSAERITYWVIDTAIKRHAADEICRQLTERSPHWHRLPVAHSAAV